MPILSFRHSLPTKGKVAVNNNIQNPGKKSTLVFAIMHISKRFTYPHDKHEQYNSELKSKNISNSENFRKHLKQRLSNLCHKTQYSNLR